MDDNTTTVIDTNIEELPEEVRDFIFGENFTKTKTELQQITQDEMLTQKIILSSAFYILGIEPSENLEKIVNELPFDEDKKMKVKAFIKENIFDELLLLTEVRKEIEEETNQTTRPQPSSVSTIAFVTKKNEGLPIVPTIRDYSLEHIGSENQSSSDSSHIDPYRELPEK